MSLNNPVFLLGCFCLFAAMAVGHEQEFNPSNKYFSIDWDFFMLVTEWPQSSCEYTNSSSHHHSCVIPSTVKGWVLHGLWPSTSQGGQQPFYCKPWKFDESKIEDLLTDLERFWPNLFADTTLTSFWKHEYEKHGTCASSVAGFESEHEFFQQAMQLRNKYDMMAVLTNSNIVPSVDPYQFSDISDAVDNEFKAKVCLECSYTKSIGQMLSGAYVCLNKQLELIDCNKCEHPCQDKDTYYHPIHY